MEPTRSVLDGIMSLKRAAHLARSTDKGQVEKDAAGESQRRSIGDRKRR